MGQLSPRLQFLSYESGAAPKTLAFWLAGREARGCCHAKKTRRRLDVLDELRIVIERVPGKLDMKRRRIGKSNKEKTKTDSDLGRRISIRRSD